MTKNTPVIARRIDGYGFLLGTMEKVVKRHGKRVYRIKTLGGNVVDCHAAQYMIQSR